MKLISRRLARILSSRGPPLNTTKLHQYRPATIALCYLLLGTVYSETECSNLVVSCTVQEKNEHSL